MNGKAIRDCTVLAGAPCVIRVFVNPRGRSDWLEPRHLGEDLEVGMSALLDVRLDEKLASGYEDSRQGLDEILGNDEPLLMPAFPPGIGKVDVNRVHASIRESGHRDASVLSKNSGPLAVAAVTQSIVHDCRPLAPDLQPQHAHRGSGETLEEKASTPGADFELYRLRVTPDNLPRINDVAL